MGWLLALLVAAWALWSWPLATGERRLVLRDVLTTHVPYKAFGARELERGSIPAINPTWNLGQPFRGNPNALAFYPGNLLYLALPFESAFHLHYSLHWLLAFLGMLRLARAFGQSPAGALLSATAWAGSGYFVSLLTFYNLIAVAAWAPWAMLGLARGGRRGVALAGLAAGLMLLGGEPITAALLLPALLLAAWEGRTARSALGLALAAGALAFLVALPQVVATARVAGFTFRAAHGLGAGDAAVQALHPFRLLELLLPLPWGWPSELGRFGYWTANVTPHVPYIYSLHIGVVAAALALFAARRRARWTALAAAALALSWAGGLSAGVTSALTAGLFRYPQKLLVLFTLAAALLAGWGLDRLLAGEGGEGSAAGVAPGRDRSRPARRLALGGGALIALAALFFLVQGPIVRHFQSTLANQGNHELARTAAAQWTVGFAIAGILLLAAAWALARRRVALLVLVQAIGLAGLAPALLTERGARFAEPSPFARRIESAPGARSVVSLPAIRPSWEPEGDYRLGEAGQRGAAHLAWLNVEPAFGVPRGFDYPVAPDLEGITSPLTVLLLRNLPGAGWEARAGWLRRLGAVWVVRPGAATAAGLERAAAEEHWGRPMALDRVLDPAPFARWPRAVETVAGPIDALERATRAAGGADVLDIAVASRPVAHRPGAQVAVVESAADRIVVDVAGEGGLLVLTRAWQPLYRARTANGERLATQPVDVALLGVEVPAGARRVVVEISGAPELAAGALAAAVAVALLFVALRREPGAQPAEGASGEAGSGASAGASARSRRWRRARLASSTTEPQSSGRSGRA